MITNNPDHILLNLLQTTPATDEQKSELVEALVQAWYARVVLVMVERLSDEEQAELEQLSKDSGFDPVSWALEFHPDWEAMVLQELGNVMAEMGAGLGIE